MDIGTICDLCGNRDIKKKYDWGEWYLLKCSTCGLEWGQPFPNATMIKSLYDSDYFNSSTPKLKGYSNYGDQNKQRIETFYFRLQEIKKLYSPISYLDIGCAYGFSMAAGEKLELQCEGIDISSHTCQVARIKGFKVHCGDFLELNINKRYDLITAWDAIEHVISPSIFFQNVHTSLEENGIFAFTTPDAGSFLARVWGKNWFEYKWPAHLYYFTRTTLIKYLGKYGFKVIYIDFSRKYTSLGNALARWIGLYELSTRISKLPILRKKINYCSFCEVLIIAQKI